MLEEISLVLDIVGMSRVSIQPNPPLQATANGAAPELYRYEADGPA